MEENESFYYIFNGRFFLPAIVLETYSTFSKANNFMIVLIFAKFYVLVFNLNVF